MVLPSDSGRQAISAQTFTTAPDVGPTKRPLSLLTVWFFRRRRKSWDTELNVVIQYKCNKSWIKDPRQTGQNLLFGCKAVGPRNGLGCKSRAKFRDISPGTRLPWLSRSESLKQRQFDVCANPYDAMDRGAATTQHISVILLHMKNIIRCHGLLKIGKEIDQTRYVPYTEKSYTRYVRTYASVGSTQTTFMSGFCSTKYFPLPASVPPVPAPATKTSMFLPVCSQISGPVVS